MSKLYFRYGAMGSAKTANLIMVAHNYEKQGKEVLVCLAGPGYPSGEHTPSHALKSRCGLRRDPNYVFCHACWSDSAKSIQLTSAYSCVLVDEAQFLTTRAVDYLRSGATAGTPVICYGLRTDFRSELFEGSKRLLEVSDSIEEIKTTCAFCERKATQNLRLVVSSDQVLIGGDESYAGACWGCFAMRTGRMS